jgi:Fe-S cluster biogenesis protein NfuA
MTQKILFLRQPIRTEMKNEIQKALNNIRPYLQADNGDVELVDVSEDGIVKVRLLGACEICPLSIMTLRAGIERAIMREVPAVKRIEAVN